jgi:LPXTG-motif cell wall-anchored protein
MSHTKTHIARAVSVLSLLLGLLAVGGTLLSSPAVAKPAKATAPAAAGCKNYKGTFVITTDNPNPEDGTTIHILGSGFPANTSVPLSANHKPIGTAVTDSTGHFSFPYTIPANAADGSTITFMANCGSVKPKTIVEVSAQAIANTVVPASTQPLPRTGSASTLPLLAAGVAFVVIGGLIVLSMRKRNQRAGHAA